MDRGNRLEFYALRIASLDLEINRLKRILRLCYLGRLISFSAFLGCLIMFGLSAFSILWVGVGFLMLLIFLMIVRFDLKQDRLLRKVQHRKTVNLEEIRSLNHEFQHRPDGIAYRDLDPHLVDDFDVFGQGSLFQYLNRCATLPGSGLFAAQLCHPEREPQRIVQRQQAIRELSDQLDFLQEFQSEGMFLTENGSEASELQQWIEDTPGRMNRMQILCYLIPAVNLVLLALMAAGILPWNLLLIPVMLGLSTVYAYRKVLQKTHSRLGRTAKTFGMYATLIRLLETREFRSSLLTGLQKSFLNQGVPASRSLEALNTLLNRFDLRFNILVSFLLNAFLVFDLQVMIRLMRWKLQHRHSVASWFQALAAMDALTGPAIFAFNHAGTLCYPEISEKEFELDALDLAHPLIHPDHSVANSFTAKGKPSVTIITGANMAGKSTFLRTLSINLILAMNGCPVPARSFRFTPVVLMSSIKIQDSLANNQSYFYAELLRLGEIIQKVPHFPALVVLDEILRGTNTRDKQAGTLGLLEKLLSLRAVVVIATHDLLIGELEKKYPEVVQNKCFEVELSNDQLIFDYKLKSGISQKLNASFLMQKMGIVE